MRHQDDNSEIDNAISTLKTIYFFENALKQGMTKIELVHFLQNELNVPEKAAFYLLNDLSTYYMYNTFSPNCKEFLEHFIKKRPCSIRKKLKEITTYRNINLL